VVMHMMSPTSRRYYNRAIIQSFAAGISFPSKEEAQDKTVSLLNVLNCTGDNIQCLRYVNKPLIKIIKLLILKHFNKYQ